MATKMVLACSHNRSLQLLARLDARTEFKILEHSLRGGVEAGRAHYCSRFNNIGNSLSRRKSRIAPYQNLYNGQFF